MDKATFNLDQAAIPEDDKSDGSAESTEGSQPEQTVEEEESTESEESSSSQNDVVEESRVPYSRFETVNERAIRAEEQLKAMTAELERSRTQSTKTASGDLPSEWIELYGDSDASKKAWGLQQSLDAKRLQEIEEAATTRAVEGLEKRQAERQKQEADTVKSIETAFTEFGSSHKRKFTDSEQSAILDIMDDLSPKDEMGRYEVDPVRYLDRAVELHDLRKQTSKAKSSVARRQVAQLTAAESEGDTLSNEKTGHFQPGQWDSWRNNPILPN